MSEVIESYKDMITKSLTFVMIVIYNLYYYYEIKQNKIKSFKEFLQRHLHVANRRASFF